LQILGLSDNKIGDPGVSALASACASGALPALQSLFLSNNPASDAAQKRAMDAIKNRK